MVRELAFTHGALYHASGSRGFLRQSSFTHHLTFRATSTFRLVNTRNTSGNQRLTRQTHRYVRHNEASQPSSSSSSSLRSCATSPSSAAVPVSSNVPEVTSRNNEIVQPNETVPGTIRQITTPLFYVNAPPHMGSAYPTMAADTLSRFYSLTGDKPMFVTGCDEHGEKIALAAKAHCGSSDSTSVQKFCDDNASQFKQLWQSLDIRYDRFVRTTSNNHAKIVNEFMERVWKNGDIYKDVYQGLYCTGCEEYKDPKELLDGDVCPIHLKSCQDRNEENYFFALSNYQTQLETFHNDHPNFVQPPERRNEVMGWITDGLRDFSVSRANNPWGIPVPRDESHTVYVWFDALLGYLSALLEEGEEPTLSNALKHGWPADVHIIGKDILRFHAVYWPAMLMSAGLPLPRRVIGHGFITKDGLKMGKSLGNTLDPAKLVADYGSDAVRYYFIKGVDFGRDGDFSEERFINIVNADLANSLGNLLNRSINLLVKNCDGELQLDSSKIGLEHSNEQFLEDERAIRNAVEHAAVKARECYAKLDFVEACETVMAISTIANAVIDRVAPWTAFKSDDPDDVSNAARCIVAMLEATRVVAVGISPVTPQVSARIYAALGLEHEYASLQWDSAMQWGRLTKGMTLEKPKPVFPRLESTVAAAANGQAAQKESKKQKQKQKQKRRVKDA